MLWAGTVGFDSPLADRFAAAVENGCDRVSLSPAELVSGERDATSIGAWARELGLELVLDPVMNWYPTVTAASSTFAAVSVDDALDVARRAGVVAMTAIATPGEAEPPAEIAGHFAALCDRAASFGAQVQLEFIPFTSVRTLRAAWQVVGDTGRDNGGVLFDSWHFHRGEPDYALLDTVPGERIFAVQLDDAPAVAQVDVRAETHHRLLPGDGALDLVRDLRALDAIGALRWIGPEVLNPELNALPVHESAALAMARSRAVVAAAFGDPRALVGRAR